MTLLIRNKKIINCECYYGFCATWMSSRRRKIIEWRPTSYKRSQTGHIFNLKGVSVCIVNQQITHYLLSPLFIYMQTQPWNVTYLVLLAVRQIYDPVSKSMAKLHYNLFLCCGRPKHSLQHNRETICVRTAVENQWADSKGVEGFMITIYAQTFHSGPKYWIATAVRRIWGSRPEKFESFGSPRVVVILFTCHFCCNDLANRISRQMAPAAPKCGDAPHFYSVRYSL